MTMNKAWTSFMVIAIVIMLAFVAYDMYISSTGGNATFSRSVVNINSSLGTTSLNRFNSLKANMPIMDTDLDNR